MENSGLSFDLMFIKVITPTKEFDTPTREFDFALSDLQSESFYY